MSILKQQFSSRRDFLLIRKRGLRVRCPLRIARSRNVFPSNPQATPF